ncbi:DUF1566 domain-containing protein [Sorangium sp. So ce204]|uniref:Lcl C-terminal domain-containing protein n=1 Tax=Sorangium sp. So ce204 TaxID=3133288 RepID=UPI003F61C24C
MKLAIRAGGAAFLMGACLGCNGVLGIDAGVSREVGATGGGESTSSTGSTGGTGGAHEGGTGGAGGAHACDDTNWAHWRPKRLDVARWESDEAKKTDYTVFDPKTSLQWALVAEPDALTWEDAENRCLNSELEGYDDWRLPSRIELVSIVNYEDHSPAIPDHFPTIPEGDSPAIPLFTGTVNKDFLWSTPVKERTSPEAWCVHVDDGYVAICGKDTCSEQAWADGNCPDGKELHRVRCVRTAGPRSGACHDYELDVEGVEVVRDRATGLTWQRNGGTSTFTRDGAAEQCEKLMLAWGKPWRLPSLQELHTIVDHARAYPVIDPELFRGPEPYRNNAEYWSSDDYPYANRDSPRDVWMVSFWGGYTRNRPPSDAGFVRCVYAEPDDVP